MKIIGVQNTVNDNKLSEQELQTYNQNILQYVGDEKDGAEVKSLITSVISMNNTHTNDPGSFIALYISIEKYTSIIGEASTSNNNETYVNENESKMEEIRELINVEKKYNIDVKYDNLGKINIVVIKEVNNINTQNNVSNNTVLNATVQNNTMSNNTIQNNVVQNNTGNNINNNISTNTSEETIKNNLRTALNARISQYSNTSNILAALSQDINSQNKVIQESLPAGYKMGNATIMGKVIKFNLTVNSNTYSVTYNPATKVVILI